MIDEIILLMALVSSLHILDSFFTVKLVQLTSLKYKNAYEQELNFHKFFFKRYGTVGGAMRSVPISLTVLNLIVLITYLKGGVKVVYFIIGMQFAIAYVNFIQMMIYPEMKRKLKLIKNSR